MRSALRILAVIGLACSLLPAPPVSAAERTHDVTLDDYFSLATITELAMSGDGAAVAYTVATWDKDDDARKTDLWIAPLAGGKPLRVTSDRANDRRPRWHPAAPATVFFLGNRKREGEKKPPYDGTTQVWCIEGWPHRAELKAVTRVEGGVTQFDVVQGAVYYSVETTATDKDDFSKLRARYDKNTYGHGTRKVSRIYRLDLETWRTEKVVDQNRYVREFAVNDRVHDHGGPRIAMITVADDTVIRSEGESRVDIAENGKIFTPPTEVYREKAASPYAWLEGLTWDDTGTLFAFCAIFDAYPAEVVIGKRDKQGGFDLSMAKRDKGVQLRGYGSPLRWSGSNLYALTEKAGEVGVSRLIVTDPVFKDWEARKLGEGNDRVTYDFAHGLTTQVRVVGGAEFPSVWVTGEKSATNLTPNLNPQTRPWKLPTVQHVTWKAPDGATVGGVLELPFGHKKGTKLPLVVAIHGGPTTASYADQRFDPHNGRLYFAANGYAVLCPNYRGSTGYGDQFTTDLIGNENDLDVKDIVAGIQHLVKEGVADPDRVGVMGWSNGGYLTNCLITLKDPPVKIRAASSGAGILDTVAEWGFNDEPAYPIVFKKGLPWERPDVYKKTSPTYGLGNVTTPTLIHVGGSDERCPAGHSRMLYRALKEYRKVPAELVVYTGEPHGLGKMTNRKAKMEWDLAWFDKYVKGTK